MSKPKQGKQRQRHKAAGALKAPDADKQHALSKPKRVVGRPFKPGQSGNPGGRAKGGASIAAALRRTLTRPDAERIAQRLIADAQAGDVQATKLLLDRIDHPLAGPLAVALASSANAQGAATFNVGVKPFELPDWHPSELTADELRALIQALEDGGAIKRKGGAVVVLPAKEPIDLAGFQEVGRKLFGIPATVQGSGNGNGGPTPIAPAAPLALAPPPAPALPAPAAPPAPQPAAAKPPAPPAPKPKPPEPPKGSLSEVDVFGDDQAKAEQAEERNGYRPASFRRARGRGFDGVR